jgi:hypothetical protein
VTFGAFDVGDKTDAAGIMLKRGIIKSVLLIFHATQFKREPIFQTNYPLLIAIKLQQNRKIIL